MNNDWGCGVYPLVVLNCDQCWCGGLVFGYGCGSVLGTMRSGQQGLNSIPMSL